MIGTIVYTILSNDSNTNTSVGGRIYPFRRDQISTLPGIAYQPLGTVPTNTKEAASTTDELNVQVSIFSETLLEMETIAGYVRTALDYYSGTVAGYVVQHSSFSDDRYQFEEDSKLYHKSLDFNFWVNR